MANRQKMIEVLSRGLIEIRLLSSVGNRCSCERVNYLSNILHNIPKGLEDIESFDMNMLRTELQKYENKFPSTGVSLSNIID